MSTLIFYERIVPLDRNTHRNLRLKAQPGHKFAADTHFVPLAAAELAPASHEYPIVFARQEDGLLPVALLGMRERENLFMGDDGWRARYVPAFVRRYPFVVAKQNDERLMVCIDEGYAGFSRDEGEPLFDAEGKDGAFLTQALGFVQGFHAEASRTAEFCKELDQLGLMREMSALAELRDGRKFRLEKFWVVDEQKLQALQSAAVIDLFRRGWLGLIYAHLLSLTNLQDLLDRTAARTAN
ncbi:MAG: SapC family protein [Rhodocyclaceae bacterium]|nr:SapC family protein [Rhodocyclaceae bacterium]MBX3670572.1 SapC family protein [Rhodocyclaceae bacterium]